MIELLESRLLRAVIRHLSRALRTGILNAHSVCFTATRMGLVGSVALLAPLGVVLVAEQVPGHESPAATTIVDACPPVGTYDVIKTGAPSSRSQASTSISPPGCNRSRL